GFSKGESLQQRRQGALLLQDWPGPRTGRISENMYLSGDDIPSQAKLAGLITFHFACYGAGTPQYDEFTPPGVTRDSIADRPFVAALPKKLLGHPKGGALASIGHIERAWGSSFLAATGADGEMTPQLAVFQSTLGALMKGLPVGAALEYFNQRYAEIASDLNIVMVNEFGGDAPTPREVADMWTSSRDARGYAIIGDPAVRLPVGTGIAPTNAPPRSRETIELSSAARVVPKAEELSAPTIANHGHDLVDTAADIVEALRKMVTDKTPVEVRTYASHDPTEASTSRDNARAITRIHFDGNVETVVPMQGDVVDTALWRAHLEMVKQAQAAHTEMIKAVLASIPKPEKK
ncbi:MAG TPA: hypothetical protein PK156_20385, partial [Polyangium sp.]|nr:hypothetical protein [Polyangium sp.]